MAGPRSYSQQTIKQLFGRSGNQCAFPDCEWVLASKESAVNSNICHIEAALPEGERYRKGMTDKERADYDNLILLCPEHHKTTDDVDVYTVDCLYQMKKEHEEKVHNLMLNKGLLNKHPSLLASVVTRISNVDIDVYKGTSAVNKFKIEDKLNYNQVVFYKPIIVEFRIYHAKLNAIYNEMEKAGSGKKNQTLRNISILYLKAKGEILNDDQSHDNIQKNSDKLLESVEFSLHDLIDKSPNSDSSLSYEEISFAISIIVVDAFMRCKILEEPK